MRGIRLKDIFDDKFVCLEVIEEHLNTLLLNIRVQVKIYEDGTYRVKSYCTTDNDVISSNRYDSFEDTLGELIAIFCAMMRTKEQLDI